MSTIKFRKCFSKFISLGLGLGFWTTVRVMSRVIVRARLGFVLGLGV